ncbi:peptidase inhibitor family I36 protein [Streptomyces sp. LX-29]|uniref:peptidase inhibitor family I36 protein n=1 Tax=Streptomyces sp. LX-29 TaxID=2900152 RepID=UPI00240D38FF|nr:peptidase inhibitor family I36 protein [Streptomyces sp. LX-29]WFB10865.1 peptidase inhibitor family I36 protein [Streptomyces sp. LX-29]
MGLTVTLLAAALVWLQSGSAQAAYADCPKNAFCLYTGARGGGAMVSVDTAARADYGKDAKLKGKTFASYRNNTDSWACLYEAPSYGGDGIRPVLPEQAGADLPKGRNGKPMALASHKFATSVSGCATGFERCETKRVCIFQGPSGRGVAGVTTQPDDLGNGVLGNADYSRTWDNKVVSVSNRSTKVACFYPNPGYTGTWKVGRALFRAYVVLPGQETTLPYAYQSSISSHKLADKESKC